jgi:hypothetical protein
MMSKNQPLDDGAFDEFILSKRQKSSRNVPMQTFNTQDDAAHVTIG